MVANGTTAKRRKPSAASQAAAATEPTEPETVVDFVLRRQLELSGGILAAIVVANAFTNPDLHVSTDLTPDPAFHFRSIPARFLHLSFRQPGTDLYFKGRDDGFLIAWWVIAFCFLREATMRWGLRPLARWSGIRSSRAVVRFAEQGWLLVYYSFSWSIGIYINQTSPYRNLNTSEFFKGYPHIALTALTKWYYLVQTAFYLQQILVINLEARRKDYYQMFAHHIITSLLMMSSYVLNWTRIGSAILCTMDLVDITLPLAKLFNYAGWQAASDVTFAVFFLLWIVTRHVIFGRIIWSIIAEAPTILPFGWSSREGYFWSKRTYWAFIGLLGMLQLIICLWFAMILRVLWNMFRGHSAEDTRSDDEDENDLDPSETEDETDATTCDDDDETTASELESSVASLPRNGGETRNGGGAGVRRRRQVAGAVTERIPEFGGANEHAAMDPVRREKAPRQ
ncbi:hypothetical protein BMF94_2508 [Rhodotorula taiwanensis]|uniref:TLC domain-containing protein n=1 Tax=Rhodotorula taiwanensis TaxID=741276 RepID=A0A2S5BC15_9BASI|nr:hypothetical protein BMF94_2508 [Rhodotorula taiwanensis]